MSINKVLNRPMFRNKALKKGHLKTINAQLGQMVGETQTISQATNPRRLPMVIDQPKPPGLFSRGLRSIGQLPFVIASDATYSALERSDPEGRLSTPVKVGASGLAGLAANYGAARIAPALMGLSYGPVLAGYGVYATLDNRIRAGIELRKRINAMSPKEREEFFRQNRLKATDYMSEGVTDQDLFGKFVPRPPKPKEPKEEIKLTGKPGSGRPGIQDRLTEADNESEVVKGTVDIDKVVKNNDPNPIIPKMIGAEDTVVEKRGPTETVTPVTGTKVTDVKTDEKANENVIKAGSNDLDKPGKIKAADGTEVNSEVIRLARQYRKELMAGQKSQAKLVFLTNLASGLMSGTTTKGGIGGALEVFGKALGPAVNNYATVKLKENELSNEFMSDALELASDEIDRANEIIEAPPIEGDPGMIQFTDSNGNLVNMRGIQAKDGTVLVARPGQLNQFGRNNYVPLAPGQFNRFVKSSELDPKALDVLMELDQKYKAYQYGKKSVALIEKFVEQGKTGAGPIGRFNLFKGRLSEALFDVTGREMFTNEDEAREKASEYRDLLIDDWLKSNEVKGKNDEEKRQNAGAAIDKILGDSVNKDKIMSAIGEFTGEADQQALSQLAINETVMVYALANSLKSKDRLTAKDIQMAKDLVNIFPLLRGQKAVIRDLKSVNATILQDISSLENTYTTALMGETETLKQYKQKYGLGTSEDFMAPQQLQPLFEDKSTNELLEMY